jgi:hypothetical protein
VNTNKLTRTIDEFCKNGILEDYRDIIQDFFCYIEKENCKICARYDSKKSSHVDGVIRISLLPIYKNSLEIIWTIFHEFGHYVSGAIDKKDEHNLEMRIASEEKAWEYAQKKITEYSKLAEQIGAFESYKSECLETYYKQRNVS